MRIENAKIRLPDESFVKKQVSSSRASVYSEEYKKEYYNISVEKLRPFKNQARKIFDPIALNNLAETIRTHGIRQPLTVISSEDDTSFYEIISGERRYRAALQVGLLVVPCIILNDKKEADTIAIIENIQREDLHPLELRKAYDGLIRIGICSTMQEIADKLRVNKSKVVDIMNLRNIEENAQNIILEHNITNRDFLRKLCKLDSANQIKQIRQYIDINKNSNNKCSKKIKLLSLILSEDKVVIECNKMHQIPYEKLLEVKSILSKLL